MYYVIAIAPQTRNKSISKAEAAHRKPRRDVKELSIQETLQDRTLFPNRGGDKFFRAHLAFDSFLNIRNKFLSLRFSISEECI